MLLLQPVCCIRILKELENEVVKTVSGEMFANIKELCLEPAPADAENKEEKAFHTYP